MADSQGQPAVEQPVDVALCIGGEVYARLWEVVRHLCVGLVDLNARVRLLSSSSEIEELTLGPIQTIVHQDLSWPLRRRRIGQVIEVLGARSPTVVHAISHQCFSLAQAVAQAFDVDLVLEVTGAVDLRALKQLDGRSATHVIAASRPLLEEVSRLGLVPADAATLVRPGVLRSSEPSCFSRADRVPSLLCTSALNEHSAVGHLVQGLRILKERGHEPLLFLLGSGHAEAELRKLTHTCGVSAQVTFAQPKAERSRVMSGADIFVQPAPERAISINSLLAMASGTAVVVCAGGVADHCLDGHTAVVCPNNSPKSLADGIEGLLVDHEYARKLASAGLDYMKEHHSVATMAERCMLLYQKLGLRRRTFALDE